MSAAFTPESPPTSDQPNSPAVCKLTPLSAAGVNPSKAVSKSSGVITEQMPPSAEKKSKTGVNDDEALMTTVDTHQVHRHLYHFMLKTHLPILSSS